MRWRLLALALEIAALGCGVLAYTNRHTTIEGVYFGSGDDAILNSLNNNWFEPFDLSQPYLWAGAAIACAVTGVVVFLLARRP
jgi:hypothetical protein